MRKSELWISLNYFMQSIENMEFITRKENASIHGGDIDRISNRLIELEGFKVISRLFHMFQKINFISEKENWSIRVSDLNAFVTKWGKK